MSISVIDVYPWHEVPDWCQQWLKDDSKIIIKMDKMTIGFYPDLKEYYDKMKPTDVAIVCQKADEHLITRLETLTEDSPDWWDFWQEVQGFGGETPSGECLQVNGWG